MTKKRISLIAIIIIALLSVFLVYWFYFSKPTAFPTDEQLVEKMNQLFPKAKVETIQDTIQLDQEHVFVPFISEENKYGVSYWVWEKHKWKSVYMDSVGEPIVWKLDRKDPSSFHIIWNVHPNDQISNANFYLLRDRGYHISYGEHTYVPRIQMEKNVSFEGESYGFLQLPNDWLNLMNQSNKLSLAQKSGVYSTSLLHDVTVFIGWMPLNQSGEMIFPTNSVNGSGYSNGNIDTNFVRILDRADLEN